MLNHWLLNPEDGYQVKLNNLPVKFLANVDSILSNDLKKNQKYIFYLPNLYSKFNDAQICLQNKDVTIIQTQSVLLNLGVKKIKAFLNCHC